jgi:hypothetical protein
MAADGKEQGGERRDEALKEKENDEVLSKTNEYRHNRE